MAQRSHVPKFGNWDNDNVPYTKYFDNARKEKGGKMINPNDPEENPEAFMFDHDGGGVEPPSPLHVSSHRSVVAEKHGVDGYSGHDGDRRSGFDQVKSGSSRKSVMSESGSDKSSSDYSLVPLEQQRRGRFEKKKNPADSTSNSFSPSLPPVNGRQKSGSNGPVENHHRVSSSVPKFGAWDEKDPASGEGFTVIFNKVKEEKHNASSTFPSICQQPSHYQDNQNKHATSSTKSKRCCCLF